MFASSPLGTSIDSASTVDDGVDFHMMRNTAFWYDLRVDTLIYNEWNSDIIMLNRPLGLMKIYGGQYIR